LCGLHGARRLFVTWHNHISYSFLQTVALPEFPQI
jgi:hypothetical protein